MTALTKIDTLDGIEKIYSGKVRDLFHVDEEHMMIVSTDRISAFDYIFPNGIPGKGIILNKISNLWFNKIDFIENHIVETDFEKFPERFKKYPEIFKDRGVIVKKTDRFDFECVARGYIIGGGWKEYCDTGRVSGIELPEGLQMAQKLENTIFTPATKADEGHDMNVPIDNMIDELGREQAEYLKEMTIKVYQFGRDMVEQVGIILADTKFEFGLDGDKIILIDEIMTPDSSRFWDKSLYSVGKSPVSYDKQFIRDYLDTTDWDKNSPAPALPDEIIEKTLEKYTEILKKIESVTL